MIFTDPTIPASTRELVYRLLRRDRLPQSVLLTGGSARLREKSALELAASVFCLSPKEGQPCGKCAACRKLKAGSHPDFIRVLPEPDRKTVSVKVMRQTVLDGLWIAPNEAQAKVYYFPNADELSELVQNALLKTIEEPPDFCVFVLDAAQKETLLPTVLSRVTEFPLGDLKEGERKATADSVASAAAGLVRALCRGTEFDLLLAAAPMVKNRAMMKKVADKLVLVVRDALAAGAGKPLSGLENEALLLGASFDRRGLLQIKSAMDRIVACAAANANENLLISQFVSLLSQAK